MATSPSVSNTLYTLTGECNWEAVLSRCNAHPQDSKYSDCNGYTPLHLALERKAPIEVIRILVQIYPEATTLQATIYNPNNLYAYLPLHTACAAGESFEVLRLLLCANPDATRLEGGFHFPNRTPLQYLWGHYFGIQKNRLWDRAPIYKKVYDYFNTLSTSDSLRIASTLTDDDIWLKLSLLLDAAHRGLVATKTSRLAYDESLLVLRAASALGLLIGSNDEYDERQIKIREACPDVLQCMIQRIVDNLISNNYEEQIIMKRPPFILALMDGLPCSTIHFLWSNDPDVISTRDCITGLFPYMLAATKAVSSLSDDYSHDFDDELKYLTLSYQLLLANPTLIIATTAAVITTN